MTTFIGRSLLPYVLVLIGLVGTLSLSAQMPEDIGQEIEEVSIIFEGPQNVSEAAVRAYIQVEPGQLFDQFIVDRSIRSLYATGFFDFIETRTEEAANGGLRLIFTVYPKYRISLIIFEGNDRINSRRLRREISSEPNDALSDRQIKEDADAIREYYQSKSFTNAEVDYELSRDSETGRGTVVFRIREGDKTRIQRVEFVGNSAIDDGDLRGWMKTKRWGWFSWLLSTGRFSEEDFEEDLIRLREGYREEGYLDVLIPEDGIQFLYPEPGRLVIQMEVEEGRQYQVGNISFDGNAIFTDFQLASVLQLRPGDVFKPSLLDEDVTTIEDVYGSRGFLDTRVRPERIPNLETGAIDIRYNLRESERFQVESIRIEGNTKTKSNVILRELALAPGQTFDMIRMKASQARLENTRFFEEVEVSPEPTNIPGRRNLKINVREGRTGNLTFGAGFSSLEEGVIFVELTQGNFDLFNWRSFFQGDGQKFRMRVSLGSRSSEFILSFEEPWLFEQRLAFGFDLFRTETDFVSDIYDELRSGFEIYFRRRLFELVEGRFAYRFENVEIFNVGFGASQFIRDEEGERTVSRLSLDLIRDTRNRLVFTSAGNRISLTTSLAGSALGGDTDYVLLDFRGSQFIPTFRWPLDQNLAILARFGSIFDLDGKFDALRPVELNDVLEGFRNPETGELYQLGEDYLRPNIPIFDRFFLGGPNSLRGFDYREVGPRDDRGEPIGGRSYAFGSFEYTFQATEQFGFAFFYDWGFVNEDAGNFEPEDFNDNVGLGIRILVLGAPMRLDYAFPLTSSSYEVGQETRENDEGGQFWFTFGTRF